MTRRRPKRRPELLGVHGLVFSSPSPEALARRWTALTGLETLSRSRREIVLGGPELFVVVRKRTGAAGDALEEVHLAVEEISVTRRKAQPDVLGGDSWSRSLGAFRLVVRQFRRPPSTRWRRKRRPR